MNWYAIAVKPQTERAVERALAQREYETYFPVLTMERRWSDRIKRVETALIPGYVFCRFDCAQRLPILTTPGVRDIVGFGRQAAPVNEAELLALRLVIAAGVPVESCEFLQRGDRVEVTTGPLRGLRGLLLDVKGQTKEPCRVVLGIELLQRSVSVEMDRSRVRRVESQMSMSAGGK